MNLPREPRTYAKLLNALLSKLLSDELRVHIALHTKEIKI